MSSRILTVATVLAVGFLVLGMDATAQGADPYFAPYGAQRGRIRIGPHRARIRWGNGLTEYGASVIQSGINILPSVLPLVLKDASGETEVSKSSSDPIELPGHYTAELRRANDLLVRSAALLGHEISQPGEGPREDGERIPPSNEFSDTPDPWGEADDPDGQGSDGIDERIKKSADPWND